MRQIQDFSDERQRGFCAYCGGLTETKDHVPSKAFLDRPLPANLPKVPACQACNRSFSKDEQYMACLIECALAGSTNWEDIERDVVSRTLRRSPRLAARLEESRQVTLDGSTCFYMEHGRVRKVVLKLARGHGAYELGEPKIEEPDTVSILPTILLSASEIDAFEAVPNPSYFPEVGSRAMQRLIEDGPGWIVAQPNNYRYLTVAAAGQIIVRFVIREYLACEVIW